VLTLLRFCVVININSFQTLLRQLNTSHSHLKLEDEVQNMTVQLMLQPYSKI
jgi:hypothetical protein